MIKFFKNIGLFFGLVILLYLSLFYCVDKGLKDSDHLEYSEWNAIYNGEIDSDIIIQGSSRAWRQVNPLTLEDSTQLSVYNLGMDGYHFPMQTCRYDIYRKQNKKPKYIIQILDHFTLKKRGNLFNKHQFIPYLKDTVLTNQLKKYEGFTWLDYNIPYFGYFGSKEITFAGLFEFLKLKDFQSPNYKGFKSSNKNWEAGFDNEKKNNQKGKRIDIRFDIFKQLDTFIKDSKKDGIEVILVYPPDYIEFQEYIINRDSIIGSYNYLAEKNDINFIDFSSDSQICNNKALFYNPTHLNSTGSKIFSAKLAAILNQLYNF